MTGTLLITGCSSGIGYHCAQGMKARGWKVVASCRKQADVERLRDEGFDSVLIDYQDEASIQAGFDEALSLMNGRIDVLFNNGAYGIPGMAEDVPTAALREIFEANFFGWHTLTRLAIPVMREQKAGRIVQCSSILGFITMPARGLIEPGPVTSKIRENNIPHYEKWIKPSAETSVWAESYRTKLEPRLYKGGTDRFELGPESVLKRLIHACESARPKPRYYVTTPTYLMGFLKRILSTRALDWVLRRAS